MAYTDPEDERAYQREWYQRNKELVKTRAVESRKRAQERKRSHVRELKGSTPCSDCEQSYPHWVMDFDHVSGEKMGAIANMANDGTSWKLFLAEIEKCEIVCANCHRIRTWSRSSVGRALS